jgi:hypothetical protein
MLNFDKLTYLPYNLIRTIRSFLTHHDLSIFPSEYTMRKQTKQLQHQYEIGTFRIDDAIIPFCRIADLASLLNITISSLFNTKRLMHYPNMPHNQIQIQTQTDKGADSTKLCIQILNQANINSVKHIIPVACYEGKTTLFIYVFILLVVCVLCVLGAREREREGGREGGIIFFFVFC